MATPLPTRPGCEEAEGCHLREVGRGAGGDVRPVRQRLEEEDVCQQRCGTGVWGFFLQLSIIDVDSRKGFAAFPQALPCGVQRRRPTPLLVVWDSVEHVLSPHISTVLGRCHQGVLSSQTQAEVGVGAQVMARAVHCHLCMV